MKPFREYIKPYIRAIPLDERYLKKKEQGNGIFSIDLPGFPTLYFRKNTSDVKVFNQIFYWREYDFIDIEFIPETIIDCGANIGLFAVWAKQRYPDAKIVSVEPASSNFEMLKLNTQSLSEVALLQKGLWDKNTNLVIVDEGEGEWQFYTKEVPAGTPDSMGAVSVDEIMKQFGMDQVDLLKIDIESAEKEVFEGDTDKWLPKVKALVIELHDRMKPGCTRSFFRALDKYDYGMEIRGENMIITFKK